VIHGVDHEALLAFLTGLVGADDAEDVASETYLAALSTKRPYTEGSAASAQTWVYGVAKIQARKWRQRLARRVTAEAAGPTPTTPTTPDWGVLLEELGVEDRALVETRLALGTVAATARALRLTRGQVRYRWGRLLRRVR
jgi:DNA-directed RNA polymerase specialized sigma24 family protein